MPGHFPKDAYGLIRFDGTALYEHDDPRKGEHQDWGTLIFNYGRHEVRNFLLSNALFWLEEYHIDGLRVDAVASMLYLDYSRKDGQWVPNRFGGRENLEAIEFVRQLNTVVHEQHPGAVMIAEESTAWPAVSRPIYTGGLGFTFKWNMGWMHDMLRYMAKDPVHRKWQHNDITFSMLYAYTENFVLPFSHDEVVHGKGSMVGKMPGDAWQKFANLRALYGYMFGHPGKKLLFMGGEFGQTREWNHDASLDWHLLEHAPHSGLLQLVTDLNRLYREERALSELDVKGEGFAWIDCNDHEHSVVSFLRRSADPADFLVFVLNFTPVVRHAYRLGVPEAGRYAERINTDAVRLRRIERREQRHRRGGGHPDARLRALGEPRAAAARVPGAEADQDRFDIASIAAHSRPVTGMTERREIRTSAKSANAGSALIAASVTGAFSRRTGAISTICSLPLRSAGSGLGPATTFAIPTTAFSPPVW